VSGARLSPLNFSGLLANAGVVDRDPRALMPGTQRRRVAIPCWKCPECYDTHDDEEDAVECCQRPLAASATEPRSSTCPVCNEKAYDARAASDCCLWKDLAAPARWAMADAVEAGSTWAEQLGVGVGRS
jgi:hypothetical protein